MPQVVAYAAEQSEEEDGDAREAGPESLVPAKGGGKRRRRASVQAWASVRSASTRDRARDQVAGAGLSRRDKLDGRRPPPNCAITGPNQAAWEAFKRIDSDKSGLLDKAEVLSLVREMGESGTIKQRQLRQELGALESEGDQISFRVFARWWNRHKEVERRRARRDVKELFDEMDADSSGKLDKQELAQFVHKASHRLKVDPPFDLDSDYALMRKGAGGVQGVSFVMFESWWKDRCGIADMDMSVLPEFIAERLKENHGNILHFHTGQERDDEELLDDTWAPRTVWIGGLPRDEAKQSVISQRLAEVGPIVSVNVRVKEGENKSWCLVTFELEEAVPKALEWAKTGAVSWKIATVEPEKMQSLSAQFVQVAQEIDSGNRGKALWIFLASRLRSLINIQKVWGDVHAMYESRDASIHHAMPLPPLIRDPDGSTAAAWDVMQVSLLIYLATVLPLRACFAIDVPAGSPAFIFDVFTDIVFIVDLVLNFRTAYYDDEGILEERPRKIASNYLHGWFAFDFVK